MFQELIHPTEAIPELRSHEEGQEPSQGPAVLKEAGHVPSNSGLCEEGTTTPRGKLIFDSIKNINLIKWAKLSLANKLHKY